MSGNFNYNEEERTSRPPETFRADNANHSGQSTPITSLEKSPQPGSADAGTQPLASSNISQMLRPAREGSIFKNRFFMLLWVAQILTQVCQHTMNIALVDYVSDLSGKSPLLTSIAIVAFVLPGVFFSALAGAFVDRVNKRIIMIWSNGLRAALIPFLLFTSHSSGSVGILLVFAVICLFSTFSQFFAPAEGAMIPFLVSEKHLTRANSLFQITLFGTQFVGMSLIAPIVPRMVGQQLFFLIIAATYAFSILLAWWLPNNIEAGDKAPKESLFKIIREELGEGWHFIRGSQTIWLAIIYLSAVQALLFSIIGIGIPYVSSRSQGLGQPESSIIFVLAPLSIGLGIGVWLVNMLVTPRRRHKIMLASILGLGVGLFGLGLLKPIAELWVSIFSPGEPIGGWGLILAMILAFQQGYCRAGVRRLLYVRQRGQYPAYLVRGGARRYYRASSDHLPDWAMYGRCGILRLPPTPQDKSGIAGQ
jgi:MFS family permease